MYRDYAPYFLWYNIFMKENFNFHQIHEERNILRKEGRELGISPESIEKNEPKKHKDFRIADYGSLSEAKREIRFQREKFDNKNFVIDWESIQNELGHEEYNTLDDIENKKNGVKALSQSRAKKLREMGNNPKKTALYQSLVSAINDEVKQRKDELKNLETEKQNISRIANLLSYRQQLFEEGHIAEVPSVENYLSKIEEAMIEGKPMFLHGPTGTGKTSLAIRAAKILTGKNPEIIYCNPQTKESNIFGKTGICIDEKTEKQITKFDPAPLIRAMQEGNIVIFDEFTALPKDMMVMLKGIMNAKVGDRRTVTGDGEITIASGFQMIFTANLKSEKNPEKQDLPPEMANEFSQNNLEIKYQEVNESYDIMLARLMDTDGSIEMSSYDMDVTLKNLSEAIVEIQTAYTEKSKDDLGGDVELKKYVLNQRNIENILSRWKTLKINGEETDFVSFLDKQLAITLTFRDFSKKDTELAAKILARKGLLSTIKAKDLGLPQEAFSFTPSDSKNAIKKSSQIKRYSLKEVSKLDPFNLRKTKANEEVDDVLAGIKQEDGNSGLELDLNSLDQEIKKLSGNKAEIDMSVQGGKVHLEIDPVTMGKLNNYGNAIKAFEETDNGSKSSVWSTLKDIHWTEPKNPNLDFVVVNHGETTTEERDKLVEDMDKLGYRVPEFSELVALGIIKPELNKIPNKYFNAYKKYSLGGDLLSPCFYLRGDGDRGLSAGGVSVGWDDGSRFLFVRKSPHQS